MRGVHTTLSPRWLPGRSAALAVGALLAAVGCGTTASSTVATDEPAVDESAKADSLLGKTMAFQAPRMWSERETAPTDEQKHFDLADHRGRVILVHFWASWCEPCRRTMPHYDKLLKGHVGEPLEVVAVNTDTDRELAKIFLGEVPVSFVNVHDEGQRITAAYEVNKLPLTVLLDREGVVRHVFQREVIEDAAAVDARVAELLAQP